GLDALVERMTDLSMPNSHGDVAEKLTGTFYSVQVGVFKFKDNSGKQAAIFEHYGRQVDIRSKTISNVSYYVVYVGHFSNYESAVQFKRKLESNHSEVFQVVAR
ncbi:MAG: SPOR domain-containing protein, partial [candidate division Zixibacteria bacterium]|nr:SPOR domain-containing protein [candidate division Zixibacteria bacterium]